MKAVGLVSGGKDSIFAMHCAREMGHQICAVATLLPRDGLLEADSYMYQSVGTGITATIAECLEVPCFNATVKGQPVLTETLNYDTTNGDEVEDLYCLLLRVTKAIPGLQAVTCGAILSEFQRRRVEHVCQRLCLVPICLLWKRPQEVLLREMISWGLHAVVVKTASMGLSRKHLGRSISELQPHFLSLKRQHGFHVCGEGGEYETLTLDCPLFEKEFIAVSQWDEVCQSEDPVAPVCLLSPAKWAAQPKEQGNEAVPLGDTARLHAIELRRFQPYEKLVAAAVKRWNAESMSAQNPHTAPSAVEFSTEDSPARSNDRDWSIHIHSTVAGCFLTADVSACSGNREAEKHCISFSPTIDRQQGLAVGLQEAVLASTGKWLDSLLRGTVSGENEAQGISLVQTICQVSHAGLISIVEDLFASRSVRPHPVTFVVVPLPQGIILRLRILFACSSGSAVPASSVWKMPADEAMLHVHSLNWWLPPCPLENHSGVDPRRLKGKCCSCQSVRCEPVSDESGSMAHIFLRGCDGRLPHSGMLPDVVGNSSLQDLDAEPGGDATTRQALNVALQVVSSFHNLRQTLRLMQAGEPDYDFSGAAVEHDAEPNGLMEGLVDPAEPLPSCVLVFVKLDSGDANASTNAAIGSVGKLTAVKDLVEGLVARFWGHVAGEMRTESPCVIITAEVSNLPGGANALLLPLWITTDRRRDMPKATLTHSFTKQVQLQGAGWKETITALKHRRGNLPNNQRIVPEESPGACLVLVSISFKQIACDEKHSSSSFLAQFQRAIARELEIHFLVGHVDDAEPCLGIDATSDRKVEKRVLEVFVFYSISCAQWLWADMQALEGECLKHILKAFSGKAFACLELPSVTFFPVRNISQGFLEVLICSVA